MTQQENSWEKLDSEFDHQLVDMKPHVLKLPHKSERQRCALWIKKLCDPVVSGSGVIARKNRNMYARLLLHMLRRGVLEGPFTHKPELGPLKTLPTYMAIYFDEPMFGDLSDQNPANLPDWVSSELGNGEETWSPTSRVIPNSTSSPHTHRRRHTYGDKLPSRTQAASALTRSANEEDQTRLALLAFLRADAEQSSFPLCLRVCIGVTQESPPFALFPGQPRISSSAYCARALKNGKEGLKVTSIEKPRYLREKPIPLSPICLKTSRGKNSTFSEDQADIQTAEKEVGCQIMPPH
ncbi:hypothetical protein JZ751_013241 [Albula glossodonta]|uniref:DUF4485 domain-containing protein n=1 Tax=Albula glossodonta TaxID=121402 RepID=A0A8T2P5C2_9TELE|nr:hypothetical protein JZ751_013241 [Albula glossodonta]